MQIAHLFAQAQAHNSNTFVVQLLLCREAAFVLNVVCRDFGATCKRMTWKRTRWSCVKNQDTQLAVHKIEHQNNNSNNNNLLFAVVVAFCYLV